MFKLFRRPNANSLLIGLAVSLLVLSSATFLSIRFSAYFNLLLGALALLMFASSRHAFGMPLKKGELAFLCAFWVASAFGVVFNEMEPALVTEVSLLFVKILFFYLLSLHIVNSKFDFLGYAANFIYWTSLISTSAYVLIYILGVDFLPYVEMGDLRTYGYVVGGYGNDIAAFSGFYRNSGYFYEPGVFAVFLTFALFVYLYDSRSYVRSLVISVVIMTTFSYVGVAIAMGLWALALFFGKKISSKIVGIIFVCVSLLWFLGSSSLLEKGSTTSFELREGDIRTSMELFFAKPIFGWGLLNDSQFRELNLSRYLIGRSSSNGVLSLLYQGGVIGFTLVFWICVRATFFFRKWGPVLAFLLWLFLSLVAQNIVFSNFFIVLIVVANTAKSRRDNSKGRAQGAI